MLELANGGRNIPTIIDTTMRVIDCRYQPWLSDRDFKRLKEFCYRLSVIFLRQPEDLRNDLGRDKGFFDVPTFH